MNVNENDGEECYEKCLKNQHYKKTEHLFSCRWYFFLGGGVVVGFELCIRSAHVTDFR